MAGKGAAAAAARAFTAWAARMELPGTAKAIASGAGDCAASAVASSQARALASLRSGPPTRLRDDWIIELVRAYGLRRLPKARRAFASCRAGEHNAVGFAVASAWAKPSPPKLGSISNQLRGYRSFSGDVGPIKNLGRGGHVMMKGNFGIQGHGMMFAQQRRNISFGGFIGTFKNLTELGKDAPAAYFKFVKFIDILPMEEKIALTVAFWGNVLVVIGLLALYYLTHTVCSEHKSVTDDAEKHRYMLSAKISEEIKTNAVFRADNSEIMLKFLQSAAARSPKENGNNWLLGSLAEENTSLRAKVAALQSELVKRTESQASYPVLENGHTESSS